MNISTTSSPRGDLLGAVRSTLACANEAIMCVAYVNEPGVNFLRRELKRLGKRARLLTTTTFGTTTAAALNSAHDLGVQIKVLNPAQSSYHPKLYFGRNGNAASAVIGSANMTGGLINNIELASTLDGDISEPALRKVSEWAEDLWLDSRGDIWTPCTPGEHERIRFHDDLLPALRSEVDHLHVFVTLGSQKENEVVELTPTDIYVHTGRSKKNQTGAQPIPAWMFNLAWEYLKQHGSLTNTFLLKELRVNRSSAVCAILGRLPQVRATSSPIRLEWQGG